MLSYLAVHIDHARNDGELVTPTNGRRSDRAVAPIRKRRGCKCRFRSGPPLDPARA